MDVHLTLMGPLLELLLMTLNKIIGIEINLIDTHLIHAIKFATDNFINIWLYIKEENAFVQILLHQQIWQIVLNAKNLVFQILMKIVVD